MKRIIHSLLVFMCLIATQVTSAEIPGTWLQHAPFDDNVIRMADTPTRTYMLSQSQIVNAEFKENKFTYAGFEIPLYSVHYHDKASDSTRPLLRADGSGCTKAKSMAYNADKGYLLITYSDLDIDMVYDDGRVINVPDLKNIIYPGNLTTNEITFDHSANCAYIATSIGYTVIDDQTHRMSEWHDYGFPVNSVAHVDNLILLSAGSFLYYAPVSATRNSAADYDVASGFDTIMNLYPLSATTCAYSYMDGNACKLNLLKVDSGAPADSGYLFGIDKNSVPCENRDGYFVSTNSYTVLLRRDDAKWSRATRLDADKKWQAASWDGSEIWFGAGRKGLWSKTLDGTEWSPAHEVIRPNAPAVYCTNNITYNPGHGMMVNSPGIDRTLANVPNQSILLSLYNNGEWSVPAPVYTNSQQANVIYKPGHMVVDPDNPDYVYIGSEQRGVLRLNLSDPEDILHMSDAADPSAALPGFVEVRDVQQAWKISRFSDLAIDPDGNIWSSTWNMDIPDKMARNTLWVWPAENRRATKDVGSFRPWHHFVVPGMVGNNMCQVLPLCHPRNKNLVILMPNIYKEMFVVVNHNGTFDDASDDKIAIINNQIDAEGNLLPNAFSIYNLFEDPDTGLIWVPYNGGVFLFDPLTAFIDPARASRIPSSEGSYLLEGINVVSIMQDSQGRKWFSTDGHGLVCTSNDGREILARFTTGNSGIPSDRVLTACENPVTGTVMVGTLNGLAEFIPETAANNVSSHIYVSPQAITPDFHGFVTISGLNNDTEVTIADEAGRTIRHLDRPVNGRVQWDGRSDEGLPVEADTYRVVSNSRRGATLAEIRVIR